MTLLDWGLVTVLRLSVSTKSIGELWEIFRFLLLLLLVEVTLILILLGDDRFAGSHQSSVINFYYLLTNSLGLRLTCRSGIAENEVVVGIYLQEFDMVPSVPRKPVS